eukprot:TRINITY_DN44893_c0_g1_i2.p3 TRINITY_DN44893_c0_g1~~TRINITY_DN44893_c0_g1_i2.p3  ORF type:complete len:102 (-),score=19.99 TRINITY_DN44893_c0_g1_i2:335-640(-)
MSRGNQRDTDRKRAAQRAAKAGGKKNEDGLTPQQRNERDKKALEEKAAKKASTKSEKQAPGMVVQGRPVLGHRVPRSAPSFINGSDQDDITAWRLRARIDY